MGILNKSFLDTLNPQVKGRFEQLFYGINQRGFDVRINSVYRSFAKQQQLRDEMGTGAAKAGYSPHNYGIAVDFNLIDQKTGKYIVKSDPKNVWEATGIPKFIRDSGFRWGGDFSPSGTGGYDPIHIDLANHFPTTRLRAMAKEIYGDNVDNIKANLLDLSKIPNSILDKVSDVIDSGNVTFGGVKTNVWPVFALGLGLSIAGLVFIVKS